MRYMRRALTCALIVCLCLMGGVWADETAKEAAAGEGGAWQGVRGGGVRGSGHVASFS